MKFLLRYLTLLGNVFPQLMICCALMYLDFSRGYAVFSIWGWGYFVNLVLKNTIRKSRPSKSQWGVPNVKGYSFPSGHSVMTLILCFTIVKFFDIPYPQAGLLYALPFLLGWSRLYFKVHHIEDVVCGWIVGYFYLIWGAAYALKFQSWLLDVFMDMLNKL